MNKDYIELLKEIKLEPTKPNRSASMHQDIRCLICSSVFNATPKSKVQNYRKHEKVGCPKCTEIARYGESREAYIEKIQSMGYEFEIIPTSRNHKVPVRSDMLSVAQATGASCFTESRRVEVPKAQRLSQ